TLYPSVDGSEFTVTNTGSVYETGTWSYSPGTDDPGVRYWAAKASNGFNLFWEVDAALTASGAACDSAGDVYNLDCLNAAQVLTSGTFSTGGPALSHITFYDTEIIPIPAAAWLFGSALGLLGWARRKST
ncbi:MAG: VPLPA-CTERM sorting domain-containing protein, partial [Gammaproteobacteria bacterium]|nr:VPLPA-CTERM sorting domain-containing protein [Gammaproteobacteria bacterium]